MSRGCWDGKSLSVEILASIGAVGTQMWVSSKETEESILIDAGDGCLRDLIVGAHDLAKLQGVLITHGHFDHVGGLFSLLTFFRVMLARTKPLTIYTPHSCPEVADVIELYESFDRGRPHFKVEQQCISDGDVIDLGPFSIRAFNVCHPSGHESGFVKDERFAFSPDATAMGYKISLGGDTIALMSDTGYSDAVKQAIDGVDFVTVEATTIEEDFKCRDVHLTEKQALDLVSVAKNYLLIHPSYQRVMGTPFK